MNQNELNPINIDEEVKNQFDNTFTDSKGKKYSVGDNGVIKRITPKPMLKKERNRNRQHGK